MTARVTSHARSDNSAAVRAEAAHAFYRLLNADQTARPAVDVAPPPSFFIVGAPRCGTTTLSSALKDHPLISFSKPKETQFFLLAPANLGDTELRATYLNLHHRELNADHLALGDGSVSYLYAPDAIREALRFDPRARFIASVRNPLDLVPSHHARMLYTLEEDEPDLAQAWALQASRAAGQSIPARCRDARVLQYGAFGRLGEHVERLIEVAGRERCLVIVYDDLARDLGAVYRQVLEFVGVPDDGRTKFSRKAENRGFKSPFLQQFVMNPPAWTLRLIQFSNGPMIRRLKRARRRLEEVNTFTRERPPLSAEMREVLRGYFAEDVRKLSALLARDLTHWLA